MLLQVVRGRRSVAVLGAGFVAGVVLTGCGAGQTLVDPAAATGPAGGAAAPAAATSTSGDLSDGLLPADAFGAGATLRQFPSGALPDADHMDDGWFDDESVTPPECLTALQQVVSAFGTPQDAAGELARNDGVMTVEALVVPAATVDVVQQLQSVVTACNSASLDDGDDHGDAQVSITSLSGLPDGMAGVSLTFSGDYSGGSWSATALAGVAQDGDRVLAMAQMSWDHGHGDDGDDGDGGDASDQGQQLDPAAFTDLLQHAYQVQSDALD
jgi:hypothetical protein